MPVDDTDPGYLSLPMKEMSTKPYFTLTSLFQTLRTGVLLFLLLLGTRAVPDAWAEAAPEAFNYSGKPYQGRVQSLPGRLECEFYDEGGEGVAYHETDGRNHGSGELNKGGTERNNFRKEENVDISYTKNDWDNSEFNLVPQELGRFYVGWTATGEWMRYTVEITQAGRYSLGFMYTSRYEGGVQLSCDDRPAGLPIHLATTANDRDQRRNWHHWNYHEQTNAVFLPAGRHVLTVKILEPGNMNLDRIEFIAARESQPGTGLATEANETKSLSPAQQLGWQLAVHSWTFQKFSLLDAIDKTAALGVKNMSISGSYNRAVDGKLIKLQTPSLTDAEFATIQEHMKARGLSAKFVNMGVVKPGADEVASRKIFDAARRFGIEVLVAEPETHGRMEELGPVMDVVEKLAKEYNIKVAIHNHPGPENFYWNPDTVLAAVKGRSPLLGACADVGHYVRSGLDPVECLKKLEGRLIALHFKDLNEKSLQAHNVPWGTGVSNVKGMLAELKRQKFKGVFCVEYEYNWEHSVPEIAASVKFFNTAVAELVK